MGQLVYPFLQEAWESVPLVLLILIARLQPRDMGWGDLRKPDSSDTQDKNSLARSPLCPGPNRHGPAKFMSPCRRSQHRPGHVAQHPCFQNAPWLALPGQSSSCWC